MLSIEFRGTRPTSCSSSLQVLRGFAPCVLSALLFYFRGSFIDVDTKYRRNAPLTALAIQFWPLSNHISLRRLLLDVFVASAIVQHLLRIQSCVRVAAFVCLCTLDMVVYSLKDPAVTQPGSKVSALKTLVSGNKENTF